MHAAVGAGVVRDADTREWQRYFSEARRRERIRHSDRFGVFSQAKADASNPARRASPCVAATWLADKGIEGRLDQETDAWVWRAIGIVLTHTTSNKKRRWFDYNHIERKQTPHEHTDTHERHKPPHTPHKSTHSCECTLSRPKHTDTKFEAKYMTTHTLLNITYIERQNHTERHSQIQQIETYEHAQKKHQTNIKRRRHTSKSSMK